VIACSERSRRRLQELSPAIIATTPIVVIPFSFLIEGEKPTIHSIVGGVIAVAGVVALAMTR
jgi:drug/metabolite transporter (DMT)-like permease